MSLLEACDETLAHVEERYALRKRHVNSAKNKRARLASLFTRDCVRGALEGNALYAAGRGFPFVAPFVDKIIGFEKIRNLQ